MFILQSYDFFLSYQLLQGTITLYRDDSERKASEQKSTETSTEDSTEDTDDGTLLEEYSTSYVCHRVSWSTDMAGCHVCKSGLILS